jgi:hypothetical protein
MVLKKPRETIEMHPSLFFPPGVEDIVIGLPPNYTDPDDVAQDNFAVEDDNVAEDDDAELPIPTAFTVVSQQVRISPGGGQVVDLIIEVEDLPGVENYEVRKTKP